MQSARFSSITLLTTSTPPYQSQLDLRSHLLNMPGLVSYPPFPDNVPTHPLLIVDYALLKAGDEEEIEKFWTAATTLGFW